MERIRACGQLHDHDIEDLSNVVGGKGAGLAIMESLGLPVPHWFVIPVTVSSRYLEEGRSFFAEQIVPQIQEELKELERTTAKELGNPQRPLLVAVRSGAPVSMPGMMDTVLNVGINDEVRDGLARDMGSPAFACDCHGRFLEMMGQTVFKIDKARFQEVQNNPVAAEGEKLITQYKEIIWRYAENTSASRRILDDPYQQLYTCIEAVFKSWMNERAIRYRRMYGISEDMGTAVVVQAMVFGNCSSNSGSGVAFTRDPSTGVKEITGEYITGCQGEEVVGGDTVRDLRPVYVLREDIPHVWSLLEKGLRTLESYFKDMQDVEFTVEEGKLYFLQTRSAKRTPLASLTFIADAVEEGLLTRAEGLESMKRLPRAGLEAVLGQERVRKDSDVPLIAIGKGVTPKVASGRVTFSIQEVLETADKGENIILVRSSTSPNDVAGIAKAAGVVTSRGGVLSHAAIVCRELLKPCVVGTNIEIDIENQTALGLGGARIGKDKVITVDGTEGKVFGGKAEVEQIGVAPRLREWLETCAQLGNQ